MPEGVRPYPRWEGTLQPGSRLWTVAGDELRRARTAMLPSLVILAGLGWGLASIIELAQNSDVESFQTWQPYLDMLGQLRWFALAAAAIVGGASLLEDHRRGALELYLTRVPERTYHAGKALAVLGITTFVVFLPALVYYIASLVFLPEHPKDWHTLALVGGLLYSLAWGIMCAGLALGVSALSRSSLAAAVVLFGTFGVLDLTASELLPGLTEDATWAILSPFDAFSSMQSVIFPVAASDTIPALWGAIAWAALTVLGWALVAWRRPRQRGAEHA